MGTEESNRIARPYKNMVPQDETLNKSLPPLWSTSIQGYHYSASATTPFITSYAVGSYIYPCMWPNQACSTSIHYESLHDSRRNNNHPTVAGGSASTSSDEVQRIFSEKNLNSMKKCDENLQPRSFVTKESRENGNGSSIPKNDTDGSSWSAASGSKGSSDIGHDTNNGIPSSKNQQCNMMLANGEVAKKVNNAVRVNKNSALQQFAVNSTEPNPNSGTRLNVSGVSPQPAKPEEDEIRKERKERKRQLNRESARRSRMRKQQECDELQKNMDTLVIENSSLRDKLMRLSEDCLEINNENNSIEEEVIKIYGLESIADLIAMKPDGVTR